MLLAPRNRLPPALKAKVDMSDPVIPATERQLKRDIGFFGAAFIAFNGAIGAGIFALPGRLHADFGGFAPWLFPIFGLLILIIALPFGRVASHYPVSGGPVRYAARFGPLVSFQAGWLLRVARVTAVGANLNLLANYGGRPGLRSAPAPAGPPSIFRLRPDRIAELHRGPTRHGRDQSVDPLKARASDRRRSAGPVAVRRLDTRPGPPPPLGALEGAALIVLYAFVGFETAVLPAGEIATRAECFPRAMIVTLIADHSPLFPGPARLWRRRCRAGPRPMRHSPPWAPLSRARPAR